MISGELLNEFAPALIGIFFATIGFTIYHFWNERKNATENGHSDNNFNRILNQRLSGILIFGILPVLLLIAIPQNLNLVNIVGSVSTETWLWFIPIAFLIILINFYISGSKGNLEMYPQIRNKEWSTSILILSSLSWIGYLLAYEFLFRGLLFFPIIDIVGLWPAILLNTGIYSLVHIPKGQKESLGSIPFGIILCFLVFETGSMWIAFFIHVVLALSNEWFSLKKHPEIKLVRK